MSVPRVSCRMYRERYADTNDQKEYEFDPSHGSFSLKSTGNQEENDQKADVSHYDMGCSSRKGLSVVARKGTPLVLAYRYRPSYPQYPVDQDHIVCRLQLPLD
jgi:hypothetical protein